MGLDLILRLAPPPASVVDVGGGASDLVDRLLEQGYRDVTVVDEDQETLTASYERVGDAPVAWICADITTWQPDRTFDVWHDGRVYRTFDDPDSRSQYWDLVRTAVGPMGHVAVACPDGTWLVERLGESASEPWHGPTGAQPR